MAARSAIGERVMVPTVTRYLRQAASAVGAAVARVRPAGRVPVLAPGPWDAPGSRTPGPGGWFTLAVEVGPGGFRVGRRVLDTTDLARAIWHCRRWRGRPVLLVTQPTAVRDGAGPVLCQLSKDLGTPVYASDHGVHFTFGRAFADQLFWCWRPGSESGEPEPVGPVLPPPAPPHPRRHARAATGTTRVAAPPPAAQPVSVLPAELPRVALPAVELGTRRPVAVTRDPTPDQPVIPEPVVPEPVTAPPVVARSAGPTWFPVRARIEDADRDRLRAALGWKFQAHARAVARAMSLHPGLRGAVASHDAGAGLVAVLALLDGDGGRVNDPLRGVGAPDEDIQLLARCAGAGLARLPAVTGPVFGAAPAGLDVARLYRPGEVLVEPAFTEVATGHGSGGAGPRYAIWSATARRLDQLRTPGGHGRAMFVAGTRFAVLSVEESHVLLRELVFDRRDAGLDERAAGKLRAALGAHPDQSTPPCLPWPLGLDSDSRRFPAGPHVKEGTP